MTMSLQSVFSGPLTNEGWFQNVPSVPNTDCGCRICYALYPKRHHPSAEFYNIYGKNTANKNLMKMINKLSHESHKKSKNMRGQDITVNWSGVDSADHMIVEESDILGRPLLESTASISTESTSSSTDSSERMKSKTFSKSVKDFFGFSSKNVESTPTPESHTEVITFKSLFGENGSAIGESGVYSSDLILLHDPFIDQENVKQVGETEALGAILNHQDNSSVSNTTNDEITSFKDKVTTKLSSVKNSSGFLRKPVQEKKDNIVKDKCQNRTAFDDKTDREEISFSSCETGVEESGPVSMENDTVVLDICDITIPASSSNIIHTPLYSNKDYAVLDVDRLKRLRVSILDPLSLKCCSQPISIELQHNRIFLEQMNNRAAIVV